MGAVVDRRSSWSAYGASGWAFLFAAFSFYYAAGGTSGLDLQAVAIQEQAGRPSFVALLWITGAMKVGAAVLALALVRPWGRRLPSRAVLVSTWGTGVLLALYGGAQLVQAVLWEMGVHHIPANIGARAARWKFLFDSFWLLGGVLFVLAAREFGRARRLRRPGTARPTRAGPLPGPRRPPPSRAGP